MGKFTFVLVFVFINSYAFSKDIYNSDNSFSTSTFRIYYSDSYVKKSRAIIKKNIKRIIRKKRNIDININKKKDFNLKIKWNKLCSNISNTNSSSLYRNSYIYIFKFYNNFPPFATFLIDGDYKNPVIEEISNNTSDFFIKTVLPDRSSYLFLTLSMIDFFPNYLLDGDAYITYTKHTHSPFVDEVGNLYIHAKDYKKLNLSNNSNLNLILKHECYHLFSLEDKINKLAKIVMLKNDEAFVSPSYFKKNILYQTILSHEYLIDAMMLFELKKEKRIEYINLLREKKGVNSRILVLEKLNKMIGTGLEQTVYEKFMALHNRILPMFENSKTFKEESKMIDRLYDRISLGSGDFNLNVLKKYNINVDEILPWLDGLKSLFLSIGKLRNESTNSF